MAEYVKSAIGVASFHGEDWMACPSCGFEFEFYEALHEECGIKKAPEYSGEIVDGGWPNRIFICPKCHKKFKI